MKKKSLCTATVASFKKSLFIGLLLILVAHAGFSQATYAWNQTGTASWAVAANWTPTRSTPLATDILLFNNGSSTTVTNVPSEAIGQLLVSANTTVSLQGNGASTVLIINGLPAGDDLTVATGSALNINGVNSTGIIIGTGATGVVAGNMSFTNAAHDLNVADANGLVFNSPAIFTQGNGCTGNVFTAAGVDKTVVFNSGSVFLQTAGSDPFALTAPLSKVDFITGSLFKYQQNTAPSFDGRTYANLEINDAAFNQTITGAGSFTADNVTITAGTLNMNLTGATAVNIKGNISVAPSAVLNFDPASASTSNLVGTTPQSITNNGTLSFGANASFLINNAAGLTLNSNITLQNLLIFANGIITVPNPAILTLTATASTIGGDNTSYVDGKLQKIGSAPFVFPVGKTINGVPSLVPIAISNLVSASATDSYTAEYKRGNASLLGPTGGSIVPGSIKRISQLDYWTLDRTVSSIFATVSVKLNWTTESSNNGSPSFITNPVDVVAIHFNTSTLIFDEFGPTSMGVGSNTIGNCVWFSWGNFSANSTTNILALASISFSNPLPVSVNYLQGIKQGAANILHWQVTCANNANATMILERSADNKIFTGINTVTATALRCQQPFEITDNSPGRGVNYYRLKTINEDGKTLYSTVVALLNAPSGFDMVSLLPNVVSTDAVLNVTSAQKTSLNVVITDITGRQVQKITRSLIAGSNQFSIQTAGLAAGTYHITGITADGLTKTLRFVKQ